jgi:hypothetical protein
MTDILKRLETRFDPRIVQPDEMARDAHAEIVRLTKERDEWQEKWLALAQASLVANGP